MVVIVMSVTGVLLTYQKQLTGWADRRAARVVVPAGGAADLAPELLLSRAAQQVGKVPTAITLRSRVDAPVEIAFGRDQRILTDPYTGRVLADGATGMREFFRTVTAWHRTLGATGERRALGRAITGASNLAFLFLVLSGFVLWWPRNWTPRAFLNVLLFRPGLSGKARDFNWHNVIGIWTAMPLAIVVASGVVISYRWAGNLVYRAAGDTPPAASPAAAAARADTVPPVADGLDAAFALARAHEPRWTTLSTQLPAPDAKRIVVTVDRGTGGQPQLRGTLTIDRSTGAVSQWEPFASQTRGRRARSILRFAHTGEVFGLVGQTLAGLVSLGAVLLAWTGLALSFRRWRQWRRRHEVRGRRVARPASRDAGDKRDTSTREAA